MVGTLAIRFCDSNEHRRLSEGAALLSVEGTKLSMRNSTIIVLAIVVIGGYTVPMWKPS